MSDSTSRFDHSGDAPGDDAPGSHAIGPSPDAGSAEETGGATANESSPVGKIQFSTDPHVAPDDQTVVASSPADGGAALPPKVPTSGDLGKILEGERLGHFHLEAFIGGGGMGAVFRGTDEMLGRTVAIKVLSPQQGSDEETTRRFRHEAQSTARLDHDHIARVYYVGVDRGWHYIVLEYVEGENLRDLVALQGPLPFADVISYTLQIAEALDHASSRDVVHRDIKPSNVLITRRKQAKLVDMGLARLHQVDNPEDDLTASGVTLGTFDYISPEQARDPRVADVRSDLYSLGCTVYFMLTGRPPFPQGTVLQKLLQHQGDAPPDPRRFRPDVPEGICRITSKLLAKNPMHRYQWPQDLAHELLTVSRQLDLPLSASVADEWQPAASRQPSWIARNLPWAAPAALLIAFVAFLLVRDGLQAEIVLPEMETVPRAVSGLSGDGALSGDRALSGEGGSGSASSRTDAMMDAGGPLPKLEDDPLADAREVTPEEAAAGQVSMDAAIETPGESAADAATDDESDAADLVADGGGTNGTEVASALVVGHQADADYRTLAAAIQNASRSDTIELRYEGRSVAAEDPLVLSGKQITIRGGEGYSPVIRFRPSSEDLATGGGAMIRVVSGRLTLINVHVELDVPRVERSSENGAAVPRLIEAVEAERIELTGCTLTVRRDATGDDENVTLPRVLRVAAPTLRRSFPALQGKAKSELAVDLEDCVVRGEAVFLDGDALGSVNCHWRNGLLAIDGPFVKVTTYETAGPPAGQLRLNLEHVTLNARRGLCAMQGSQGSRSFPSVKLNLVDCIVKTAGVPLITQQSWHDQKVLQSALQWSGHNNGFDGFEVFWQIDPGFGSQAVRMEWGQWSDFWPASGGSSLRRVAWQQPVSNADAASVHRAEDYRLRREDNPAVGGATDGMSDIGFIADELPLLPAEPARR